MLWTLFFAGDIRARAQDGGATTATEQEPEAPAQPNRYMGREIAQTMHWRGAEWLLRETREKEENATMLLDALRLEPGWTVADVGCGNGFHSLRMAKAVAPGGSVIGVDIQEPMLRMLRERAAEADVENVRGLLGTATDPKLEKATCDLLLLVDVYHEFSDPAAMLARLRAALKPTGRLALVEFRAEDPAVPIKPLHKMSKVQMRRELEANGLVLVEEFDALPWQHLMFFARDDAPGVLADHDRHLAELLDKHGVHGMSVGLLRGGELTWSGYYGEQAPGVPVTRRSMFNTASISKAVTTEMVLQLVEQGSIELDESMADFWVDPDLRGDPRCALLTPRIVLTHRTGFPNWRFMADDGKLAFEADPGERFGYSGEGMQYLKRFIEVKLGRSFEDLVQELIFDRLGMRSSAVVARDWMEGRTVLPRSSEGELLEPNVNSPGEANAADDLFTTVEDYATLLTTLVAGEEARSALELEKMQLQTSVAEHEQWKCRPGPATRCPTSHGFGLGWLVFEWPGEKIVWHGGNDQHEHAIGYIDPNSGDGAIVFTNGSNGIFAMLDALDLIDDSPPIVDFYRSILNSAK